MKRLAVVAALLIAAAIPAIAADWTSIAKGLDDSVVYIESQTGSCTGFIIDNKRDYVLTAAHCDGDKLYVDGKPAKVVAKDRKKDLLVLFVEGIDGRPLKLADRNPKRGQELLSFGYGYGLDHPMARVAHVADDDTYIPEGGIGGPFIVTDSSFVGGQSGGPVVNERGEVSMIVQMGTDLVGIGVGAEIIEDKVGKYFEQAAAKP